ncbi:restriction endonuclease type i hsds [Lucifera butyrica]|uniref:Restriction endonuclease type i hsds n=1 Tax=Lucifera butyrica TaxID=1351585 RepID=A0A498R730_9FIRM|nr:restriction endonuclease subunit S [Lucifera butyrica]VBB07171.1 restriction endonuclease type i hsds [Lucifera butyrica]
MSKWEKVRLGSIGDFQSGGTPTRQESKYFKGNVPWITTISLGKTYVNKEDAVELITDEAIKNSATKRIKKNSLMIGIRVGVGKVSINSVEMCTSQDILSITNIDEKLFSKEYLVYCIKSFFHFLNTQKRGATIQGITSGVLKGLSIPCPPFDIQKQIAQTLDVAARLIALRKKQLEELDNLIKSTFYDMFGDPMVNEKGWEIVHIKELSKKIQYGTSSKADESKREYPILRMNNITYSGSMNLSNLKYIDLEEQDKEKYLVYKGDLLFNRTNSKELVGKTAVFKEEQPMAFAGYLVKLIPNEKANSEFISSYLNSSYGKKLLLSMAKNIIGMANINAKEFGNISIYLPPLPLQTQFASIVTKIEEQKALVQKAIDESQYLFDSLMSEYFE